MIRVHSLLIAFALIATAAGQSFAETKPSAPKAKPAATEPVGAEPEATTASYGVWILRCQHRQQGDVSRHVCEVDQSVVPQGQQNPIAQMGIGRPTPEDEYHMTVILPTNITFQVVPKVSAQDSDPGVELAWRRCVPGGCIADTVLREETLRAWHSVEADTGRLYFTDASGRNVAIQFSFRGFGQAMDALAREH